MKLFANVLLAGMIVAVSGVSAQAAVENGKEAPDFTLTDTSGQTHTLSQHRGSYVVLEWTNYECPFVRKHYDSNNMQALQESFGAKGVVWLSVNSSAAGKQGNYSAEEWTQKIAEQNVKAAAVLLDADGQVGNQYGAKTTPHLYIIDPQGVLIYQGAIDSNPSADAADITSSTNYVSAALDQAMKGEPVAEAVTTPYGCSVKY